MNVFQPSASSVREASPWQEIASRRVLREPLIDTRTSLAALARTPSSSRPRTIFVGVGLCARGMLSRAVPLDLMGLVLPGEQLRRDLGASELLVMIADTHALENGFPAAEVQVHAAAMESVLHRIRAACRFPAMRVLRASELHRTARYAQLLDQLRARARGELHEYVLQQFADVLYLDEQRGPLLKLGWSLPSEDPARQRDEVMLDAKLTALTGVKIPFIYCKPARTLADAAPRMPPYVVKSPERRLCLDRPEDAARKLRTASQSASSHTVSGFLRHVRRLVYTYCRVVGPLPRGPLSLRVASMIDRLAVTDARTANAPAPRRMSARVMPETGPRVRSSRSAG